MPDDVMQLILANRGRTAPATSGAPSAKAPVPAAKKGGGTMQGIEDLLTGFLAQGPGQTAFDLGHAVHSTPILGNLTDALAKLVGPEGTDPSTAFNHNPPELEPTSTMGKVGKGAEQIAEYFVPAGGTRKAITKGLVKAIPNSAGPKVMKALNKTAAITGRVVGEGTSAGAMSALHDNENPETAAEMGAGGAASTEALVQLTKLLTSGAGRKIAPVLLASSVLGGMPNITGLAGTMGMYGLIKKPIEAFLKNPIARRTLERGARVGGTQGTRAAVGVEGQMEEKGGIPDPHRQNGPRTLPTPHQSPNKAPLPTMNRDMEAWILKMLGQDTPEGAPIADIKDERNMRRGFGMPYSAFGMTP